MPSRARVAILGDMLELGEAGSILHQEIGSQAARLNIDYLGLVGEYARQSGRARRKAAWSASELYVLRTRKVRLIRVNALVHSGRLQAGDWILVKASRGLALDTVVRELVEQC